MFKLTLRNMWRNLLKDRQFTLLNIIGLSTGLCCALLIYLWVQDERRIDKFHANDARLYQVMERRVKSNGIWTAKSNSGPMEEALRREMPEIDKAVSTIPAEENILSVDEAKPVRANGKQASNDFFNIFSYELLWGDAPHVLADKQSMVLSDELAAKLFGTPAQAVGKTLRLNRGENMLVTGVFKNHKEASSDKFDFVISIDRSRDKDGSLGAWGSTYLNVFVLLKPGTDVAKFNAKFANFVKQHTEGKVTHRTPFLAHYSDLYLFGHYTDGKQDGGRIDYVRLFSVIAIFILLIACINFMNLATAKAAGRAREVGIKKAVGASRGVLILQYLGESTLMAFLSLAVALVMAAALLPLFNQVTGKTLSLLQVGPGFAQVTLLITVLTGLLAGSYPALYLARYNPAIVLKGEPRSAKGETFVRKGLVIFQFSLSVILIISVLVVYQQLHYLQTRNLGYDRTRVITFFKEGKLRDLATQQAFEAAAAGIPGVAHISSMSHNLTGHTGGTYGVQWPGRDPNDKTEFEILQADYDLPETLGMQVKEGRTFSRAFAGDTARLVFNEAAIRYMGLEDPVGKTVKLWDQEVQIIGVVKDFNFESMHEKINPLFMMLSPGSTYRFLVQLEPGHEQQAVEGIRQLYTKFNPGFPFEFKYMDDDFQVLYKSEQQVSALSRYFAGLAILISCLGLFGLAAFTAQKRNKEIGIRKVLGATVSGVVMLLSKDFLRLVLISVLIASPLAWWMMNKWLNGFAFRVDVSPAVFLLAAGGILVITLITVSFQSIRAAMINPVKSLKAD